MHALSKLQSMLIQVTLQKIDRKSKPIKKESKQLTESLQSK
jgi:hypothetical protein